MEKGENTVLVVDGGGRGAVLAHAYSKSPSVGRIIAVPGNDLMSVNTGDVPVETHPELKTTSVDEIVQLCHKHAVDLVDVAQDNAVERGLVNRLRWEKIRVLGPTRLAGWLESDKAYARDFMHSYAIPHPNFSVFASTEKAKAFLRSMTGRPWVVKANGLAEGKGVIIAHNREEAIAAVHAMQRFGDAGKQFLIEEYLEGEEFSSYALSDGEHYKILGHAQDHKRVGDGDTGPNTGGMGCSRPPLVITPEIETQIDDIFRKTFAGMRDQKTPYTGILYLGGMVVGGKVFVIEYNARWGDPEAQVIAPGIHSDFFEMSRAAVEGRIADMTLQTDHRARVAIAGVSRGYPGNYSAVKGKRVMGLERACTIPGVTVYGAGIKRVGDMLQAFGGRLFYVVGEGRDVLEARDTAMHAMKNIDVEGDNLHYRTDIGSRDVTRLMMRK